MTTSPVAKSLFAAVVTLFLSNGGASATSLKEFCSYSISDYDSIRNEVEALFRNGLKLAEARVKISQLGLKKIDELQLIETKNRRAVVIDGKPVVSKEKLISALIECSLPENNKNIWKLILYVSASDRIRESGFYIGVDDQKFASRGVPLRAAYVGSDKIQSSVIRSLVKSRFPQWKALKQYLLQAGFRVIERKIENSKESAATIKNPGDFNRLSVRVAGGTFGLQAGVTIGENGMVLNVRP